MQKELFPSSFIKTANVNLVLPKNRNFQIDSEKVYEASLLEKDDLIKISKG